MCRRRFWILALLAVAAVIVFAGAVAALSHLSWWHSYRMRGPIGRGWSQILPMRPWLHRPGLPFHRTWAGFPALLCGLGLLCPVGVALLLVALLVGLFHRRSRGPGLGPAGRSWHEHVQRHDVPGHGAEHEESFNAKVSPGQRAEESPGNKPDES
jgi:hypothetical protein